MKFSSIRNSLASQAWQEWFLGLGLTDRALEELQVPRRLQILDDLARTILGCADEDDVALFSAPGRIVFLGEYMEGLGGQVLGGTLHLDILAIARPRMDQRVCLSSWGYDSLMEVNIRDVDIHSEELGTPQAFIRGIARELSIRDVPVRGMDICMHSLLPPGAGFASSAAFSHTLLWAFLEFSGSTVLFDERDRMEIARSAKVHHFGRGASAADLLLVQAGALGRTDHGDREYPVLQRIPMPPLLHEYTIFMVETWRAFDDEEEDRENLEKELGCVSSVVEAVKGTSLLQQDEDAYADSFARICNSCSERAFLRGLYMVEEHHRIERAVQAVESPHGVSAFLDHVNISNALAYRQLQNVWPDSHPGTRSLVLGMERTERWLRSMGMPGAVHVHGKGFFGSFYAIIPRNMAMAYRELTDGMFGPGSAREIYLRTHGPCRLDGSAQ